MIARIGLSKLILLSGAVLMVIVGFALSGVTGDREIAAAPRQVSSAGPPPLSIGFEMSAEPAASDPTSTTEPERKASEPERSEAAEKPAETAETSKPQVKAESVVTPRPTPKPATSSKPTPKTSTTRSLPPLPPPEWSMTDAPAEPTGPPPGVLWLSGVIQGDPRVALLRRGDSRYVVKEGDIIEDRYVVSEIGNNSVTLKYGSRTKTLRVGQY